MTPFKCFIQFYKAVCDYYKEKVCNGWGETINSRNGHLEVFPVEDQFSQYKSMRCWQK